MIENIKIKTPEQISGIRKSAQLAAKCLDYIEQFVKPGVTTAEINDKAVEFMNKHEAKAACLNYMGPFGIPFPKETCTSVNEEICHGIPSERVLKEGDILNVDVTTILNGYYGDTCRMCAVGEISPKAKRLLEDTRHCLEIGINQVRPGNHIGNIGYYISQYAKSKGYSVVAEFTGHGIGLEFHEPPQICHASAKNSGPIMKPGMIFTIEPMINIGQRYTIIDENDKWTVRTADGSLSAQYEHTVLVTEDGVEILSDLSAKD